jgi:uncharacterized tellurite resistance protein B-like protein
MPTIVRIMKGNIDIHELIKDIEPNGSSREDEQKLLDALGEEAHEIILYVVRNSWTLTYDVPKDYLTGRCICGNLTNNAGPEVEVMFHNARESEIEKIKKGERLRLNVQYSKFDNLYRRTSFIEAPEDIENPIVKVVDLENPQEQPITPSAIHHYLANILTIAYADGNLCPEEDAVLDTILTSLGAKIQDMDLALQIASKEEFQGKIVGTFSEQVRNLEDMMRICIADGEVHENENQWISYFAGLIGLDQPQMDKLYQNLDSSIQY